MKRKTTILFIQLFLVGISYAQSCLPSGITFTTQQQIDDFSSNYPSCTTIEGLVNIGSIGVGGSNITNLNGLSMLTNIEGSLTFAVTSLTNFTGLTNLASVGENLFISYNSALTSMIGLESLSSIGGDLEIVSNPLLENLLGLNNLTAVGGNLEIRVSGGILQNLNGLQGLTSVGGYLSIESNVGLINLEGLNNLQSINGNLRIGSNPNLTSLNGLNNLSSIDGYLYIRDNSNLLNLNTLENLTTVEGLIYISGNPSLISIIGIKNINPNLVIASNISNADLEISRNPLLSICHVQSICGILEITGRTKDIHDNASGCNTTSEIENACAVLPVSSYLLSDSSITIFPNPSESEINIRFSNVNYGNNYNIAIFNVIGKKIGNYNKLVNGNNIKLNISTLPSGVYFITIEFDNKIVTKKIVKN